MVQTILLLHDDDVDRAAEGSRVDGVPSLGDRTECRPYVLHYPDRTRGTSDVEMGSLAQTTRGVSVVVP